MSFFKKIVGTPAATLMPNMGDLDVGLAPYGDQPYSGRRVTRMRALQLMTVWRCVDILSTSIATMPVNVYTKGKDGVRKSLETPTWLDRPAAWQTATDFFHRAMVSMLTEGNAFIWTQRDSRGNVAGLQVLDPFRVRIIMNDERTDIEFLVDGQRFDRSWILWIPNFSVDWQMRGISPIEAARQAIDLGLTIEEFGAQFFHQGASLSGIIQHPGNPSTDEVDMLRQMFKKKHTGVKNSHAIGILTGAAEWKNITVTPNEAQFLESRKYQNVDIALLYGVPPYLVDAAARTTWGNGIEEQNSFFTIFSLQKYIVKFEQAITQFLLPGKQYVKFDVDSRLRPNTAARYQAYEQAINSGWLNRDEVRAKEDLPPIEDGAGTVYYRPLNYAPLSTPAEIKAAQDQAQAAAAAAVESSEPDEPDPEEPDPNESDTGGKQTNE